MTIGMWGHKCTDGAGMAINKGEPCNWCGATEKVAGWLLPYEAVKHLTSLPKLLEHAKRAHYTNAIVRKDGQETTYEADWIKHMRWVDAAPVAAQPTDAQMLDALKRIAQLSAPPCPERQERHDEH